MLMLTCCNVPKIAQWIDVAIREKDNRINEATVTIDEQAKALTTVKQQVIDTVKKMTLLEQSHVQKSNELVALKARVAKQDAELATARTRLSKQNEDIATLTKRLNKKLKHATAVTATKAAQNKDLAKPLRRIRNTDDAILAALEQDKEFIQKLSSLSEKGKMQFAKAKFKELKRISSKKRKANIKSVKTKKTKKLAHQCDLISLIPPKPTEKSHIHHKKKRKPTNKITPPCRSPSRKRVRICDRCKRHHKSSKYCQQNGHLPQLLTSVSGSVAGKTDRKQSHNATTTHGHTKRPPKPAIVPGAGAPSVVSCSATTLCSESISR